MINFYRRGISLFLVSLMVLCSSQALTYVYAYGQTTTTENHYLGFASDLHDTEGTLEGAFGNFPNDPEYVSLVGDMVGARGGDSPAYNSSDILSRIMAVDTCKNINSSNASIIWADHDAGVTDDAGIVKGMGNPAGYTSGQIYEGKNSDGSTAYYIYVVGFYHMLKGGDISKNAATEFKSWVADKDVTIPVIVLCHAPLVAKRGDNYGATYWNEALNYAATGVEDITSDSDENKDIPLIRNVIYLSGHNHTVDTAEYYYSVGSVMKVQVDSNSGLLSASGDTTVTEAYDEEVADLEEASQNTSSPASADAASKSASLLSEDLNDDSEDSTDDSDSEDSNTGDEESADVSETDSDSDDSGSLTAPGGSGSKPAPNVKATGKDSVVYYTALTPGYLKTSGSATLLTISDKTITLDKYNSSGETALGVTASGDSVASPQSIDRIEWDDPVYTWSDDLSTVTATRALKSNPDYTESETVSTTKTVSKQPTSTEKGEHTYAATFSNPAFETQTKVVADIDPVSEDEDSADSSDTDTDSSSPKTGDSPEIILWTTLLALAAAEIAIIGLKKRKD